MPSPLRKRSELSFVDMEWPFGVRVDDGDLRHCFILDQARQFAHVPDGPGRTSPTYANTCPCAFSATAEDTVRHVSVVDGSGHGKSCRFHVQDLNLRGRYHTAETSEDWRLLSSSSAK